jgi:hypothetical protein
MNYDSEGFPAFFAAVPPVALRDPLAEVLGAAQGGLITYRYVDAVRLAGHSCPTVAAAWGMIRQALRMLYGNENPVRGEIEVHLAGNQDTGVTGVIGSIVTLVTGAAGSGGFKGLGGRYARRGLLRFGEDLPMEMRFTRRDTGFSIDITADLSVVPPSPLMGPLLQAIIGGADGPAQRAEFADLWQERVRRILIEHADDPNLFVIKH